MRIRAGWVIALVCWAAVGRGESRPAVTVAAPAAEVKTVTAAEYRVELGRVRGVVRGCETDANGCNSGLILYDLRVSDGGFDANWAWLRAALDEAKKAKAEDRGRVMAEAGARLDEDMREAGGGGEENGVEFAKARKGADEVLARGEFRHVTEQAYWEAVVARVGRWIGRLFSGAAGWGKYAAWIGPALEWGFVLAVAVGAVLWGLSMVRRQRLAIALEGPGKVRDWEEASRKWAEAAKAAADQGEWREAVHALYWACVVELEGRRVWRLTRERTPREYLRLLEAGSPYVGPVKGLTQLLERIWYGLGHAERGDYDRALALYEEVRAA